jgi:hypothetical protein
MIDVAQNSFPEHLQILARAIRFVCLLCDAGTVLNPSLSAAHSPVIIHAEFYERSFRETITNFTGEDFSLEICGVICDNLSAQVSGLHRFLGGEGGKLARSLFEPHDGPCLRARNHRRCFLLKLLILSLELDAPFP